MVNLLRRKPKFGFVGGPLRGLLGGGQFAPPMTEFFERFFHILDENENEQIANAIPQKGLVYKIEQDAGVLVGVVKSDSKEYQSFIDKKAELYYTGRKFPSTLNILSFKFFAPYYDGGIREYYKITGIRTAIKAEIEKHEEDANDGVRIFFELGECTMLSGDPIQLSLINDTYQKTTVKALSVLKKVVE